MARNAALAPRDAFFGVIYDHRYLAAACAAWKQFGPDGSPSDQSDINKLLPGVGVHVQDSLLLRARLLIDFYCKPNPGETDVSLIDFDLPSLDSTRRATLEEFKNPIEVHVLHLTAWRDITYRTAEASSSQGQTRSRPDWNAVNAKIAEAILDALEAVSQGQGAWAIPFLALHHASTALMANLAFPWPAHLTEKSNVDVYLGNLGL